MRWIVILRADEIIIANWKIEGEPSALKAMATAIRLFGREDRLAFGALKMTLSAERVLK